MTTQPTALRIADELDDWSDGPGTHLLTEKAAAEMRRLYQSEREGWRHADELEQERRRQADRIATLEFALQQAVEALDPFVTPNWAGRGVDEANAATATIKAALRERPALR